MVRSELAEQCLALGSAYENLKETSKNLKRAETGKPVLKTGWVAVNFNMVWEFVGNEY